MFSFCFSLTLHSLFFKLKASMKEVIVRRLALSHLMMGLSDGFQNVLIEHYMLSMVKRLATIRLLAIADVAEQEWNSVIDVRQAIRFLVNTISLYTKAI